MRYPEAHEGVACAGTAIESVTVKVKKKAFLFIRDADARFKVSASLDELKRLAAASPDRYEAADNGWIKITFANGATPTEEQANRWIDESYRVMATKTLLKQLDANPIR